MTSPPTNRAGRAPLGAVLFLLGAQGMFNLVDATGKYLVQDFPVVTVVWARYFFHLLFMIAYIAVHWEPGVLQSRRPGLQITRAVVLLGFALFLFAALKFLPQAEAVAISFVAPLLILSLAGPLLGEHVGWARWMAVIAGFIGMLIVVRPGSGLAPIGIAFALATLLCNAAFQLLTRKLAMTERPLATILYSAAVGTAGATLLLPFDWPDHWPNAWQAMLFLSFGITGSISHLLLIRAYRLAPASFIAPFIYGHIVMATISGWIFFGQFPDGATLAGIATICASGALIALYEQSKRAR